MNNLSQRLAALMQDDSVPMSDAWGKLFDDLKQADCDLGELLALREAGEEPVAWEVKGILCHTLEEAQLYVGEPEPLYAAPQLPAVPEYPECLPCPVLLEPGLRLGVGIKTSSLLEALSRRAEYYARLEAMTPEEREEHDAGIAAFKTMLDGAIAAAPKPE